MTWKPAFGEFLGTWHRWFAWYPVLTYDQRRVWLRPVWRRCVQLHDYLYNPHNCDFWFVYAIEEQNHPQARRGSDEKAAQE